MTSERQETENRDEFGYSESDIVKHHGNPVWEAIWSTIKRWDISRKNDGLYSSATGTDVQVIFDAVAAALRAATSQGGELSALAAEVNEINRANGWKVPSPESWDDDHHIPALLALVHSEVSEALEGFRNGDRANVAEEIADVVIRCLDLSFGLGINLDAEVRAKLTKNRARGHKHGGKRV